MSTVGISLPKTGVPTVCSERTVSGILYAESTLSTGYTQYVYTVIRGHLLLCRDLEGVVVTSGLLAILGYSWPWKICFNAIEISFTLLNQTTSFSQITPIYFEQISFSLQARLSKYTKIKLVAVQVSITKLYLEIQVEIGQDFPEIEKANIVKRR